MSLWEPPNLAGMRISYDKGQLVEEDLAPTPLAQFTAWLADASDAGLPEPNAMVLATVDADAVPCARSVLLKGIDERGLSFFTNSTSRKGTQLAANPHAAVVFPWYALQRQVTVIGEVERLPRAETEEYFASRPHGSRLAAWASHQSTPIEDRAVLEQRYAELEKRWPEGTAVPVPEFWSGYLLRPDSMEFWHGRRSRMHDRLRFEALVGGASLDETSAWRVQRYAP